MNIDNESLLDNPPPQNEFILFRRNFSKGLQERNLAASRISINARKEWEITSLEVRLFFIKLSVLAAAEHRRIYLCPGMNQFDQFQQYPYPNVIITQQQQQAESSKLFDN
ncbi:11446_t:CDS:2 [Entrophospora sp. SA101]|nr:11446_t:CDS:2 [Entrophospora sp. SA101]